MEKQDYYVEIENCIKRNEINKKRRVLEENYDTLRNYWEIGKLLVEAQGGVDHKIYGNTLIKKWSIEYTKNYGSGYSYANMARFRQFYEAFSTFAPVERISWTNIKILLPIKDINKRNYFIRHDFLSTPPDGSFMMLHIHNPSVIYAVYRSQLYTASFEQSNYQK